MAVTNIYLARHGETEFNRCNQIQGRGIDASLNDTGRQQAEAIARFLRPVDMHRIYSSSLKRSKETASLIAQSFDLEVESHQDLDEMNFGIFEGRPISEIETELKHLHLTWKNGDVDHASENGESPRAVLIRAGNKLDAILREHPESNLLFILHGRLLRIVLSDWLEFGLQQMHRIPHSNGALYHLQWDGTSFESIFLNKTEHLETIGQQ